MDFRLSFVFAACCMLEPRRSAAMKERSRSAFLAPAAAVPPAAMMDSLAV